MQQLRSAVEVREELRSAVLEPDGVPLGRFNNRVKYKQWKKLILAEILLSNE